MKRNTDKNLSLEDYNLEWETHEGEKVSTTAIKSTRKTSRSTKSAETQPSIGGKIKQSLTSAKTTLVGKFKKSKRTRKNSRKLTKAERETVKKQRLNAIIGIGLLLVVVSIAYSTAVIYIGVDSNASKLALLPQVTFALITLFKAFSKLYK